MVKGGHEEFGYPSLVDEGPYIRRGSVFISVRGFTKELGGIIV